MEYVKDRKTSVHELFGFVFKFRRHFLDTNIIHENFCENNYQIPDNPKIVIDVGANIGTVSLICARKGAEVFAFEPEMSNYNLLCENVEVNGYKDRVHCLREAVGLSGDIRLYVHPLTSGGHSSYLELIPGLKAGEYQTVRSLSIAEVFEKYNIEHCSLLKLDCEGSEEVIIKDIDNDLARKIDQIAVETHDRKIESILVDHLRQWYKPERTSRRRHAWVFKH
jgi:FkbM family methyltransferase